MVPLQPLHDALPLFAYSALKSLILSFCLQSPTLSAELSSVIKLKTTKETITTFIYNILNINCSLLTPDMSKTECV
jgi:hypothetical protein